MRIDLNEIQHWIKQGSRILDLGCGDGTLLKYLKDSKNVEGYGLEIDPEQINICIEKNVNVIEQNLDRGLGNFTDNSFDTVLMTQAFKPCTFLTKCWMKCCVSAKNVLSLSPILVIGKRATISLPAGVCRYRICCLTNGITHPLFTFVRLKILKCYVVKKISK